MRIFLGIMKYITLVVLMCTALLLGYNISIGDNTHVATNIINLLSLSVSLYVFQSTLADY